MLSNPILASTQDFFEPGRLAFNEAANSLILPIFWFVCMLTSFLCAAIHEAANRRQSANEPKYTWGYFVAYYLMTWPIFLALNQLTRSGATLGDVFGAYVGGAIVFSIAGVFALRGCKIGFVLGSLLSLNPIIWIGSAVFLFTRGKKVWSKGERNSQMYFLHDGVEQVGPFDASQVKKYVAKHPTQSALLYWNADTNEWNKADTLLAQLRRQRWRASVMVSGIIGLSILGAFALVMIMSRSSPVGVSDVVSATPFPEFDPGRARSSLAQADGADLFTTGADRRFHGIKLNFVYTDLIRVPDGQFEHFYSRKSMETSPFPLMTFGVWQSKDQKFPVFPAGHLLTKDQARAFLPRGAGLQGVEPAPTQGLAGSMIKFNLALGDIGDPRIAGRLFVLQTKQLTITLQSLAIEEPPDSGQMGAMSEAIKNIAKTIDVELE